MLSCAFCSKKKGKKRERKEGKEWLCKIIIIIKLCSIKNEHNAEKKYNHALSKLIKEGFLGEESKHKGGAFLFISSYTITTIYHTHFARS